MQYLKKRMAMKFHALLSLCIGLLSSVSVAVSAQDATLSKMKKFFTNISAYNSQFTQEKVYLHLDNDAYFPGETIWFKAYTMKAGDLFPTDMSKVLYVELLTPEGEVVSRQTCPLNGGRTYGELPLTDIVRSGFYEVRAYTRAMLNWDASYVYRRIIPVFDPPTDSLNYGRLTMYEPENVPDKSLRRPVPAPLQESYTLKESKVRLTCYPEGGEWVKGVEQQVAYRLTDARGLPLDSALHFFKADGTPLLTSQPEHEGMGSWTKPADWQGGYVEVANTKGKVQRLDLKEVGGEGCALHAYSDSTEAVYLTLQASAGWTSQTVGVSVTCRGIACYFDTVSLSPSGHAQRRIPRLKMRTGVNQITLFTPEGQILAERMVWVGTHRKGPQLKIAQNATSYEPFSPIVLDFTLTDEYGKPLQGEFSLSVQDDAGRLVPDGDDINEHLLLCSDLRGYIHQPRYYLGGDNPQRLRHMDLLMQVQGSRRYDWREMAGIRPFELRQPVEEGILIDGRLVDNSSKHRGKNGWDVDLMIMNGAKFMTGSAHTDTLGNFAMMAPKFYGDRMAYFTALMDGKRKACNVALNRSFSPQPQPYEPVAMQLDTLPVIQKTFTPQEPEIFTWVDTLPKAIHLPEATVREKRITHPYGSRFTWCGGENSARPLANMYYNIEDELERYRDQGEKEPGLWDWLATRNKNFFVEQPDVNTTSETISDTDSDPILLYKNRRVNILIDNAAPLGSIDYDMSDIRSLYICEADDAAQRAINAEPVASTGNRTVTFFLYSSLGKMQIKERKGQRITVLHGYSNPTEFDAPNYRMGNNPTPSDVRRTLHWTPTIVTDKQGKASVILFSNARNSQTLHINAQGIAINGKTFSAISQ